MKRYIKCNIELKSPQMSKSDFIKEVLSDVRRLRSNKVKATRWAETIYVVDKTTGAFERWFYDLHNDPDTNEFLTKFVVDDNTLRHTVYDWTSWVPYKTRVDSEIKLFLEREVGKSFVNI